MSTGQEDSETTQEASHEDELTAFRLDFAKHVFENAQSLNQVIDTKANNLIATVGVLTAALGILAAGALGGKVSLEWPGILAIIGLVLTLAYLLVAFNV